MHVVAILVAAFIIFIPAIALLMMLAISIPLSQNRFRQWLAPVAKGLFLIQGWSMVEVFIIGGIVSLVKIAAMATVEIGLSFGRTWLLPFVSPWRSAIWTATNAGSALRP